MVVQNICVKSSWAAAGRYLINLPPIRLNVRDYTSNSKTRRLETHGDSYLP